MIIPWKCILYLGRCDLLGSRKSLILIKENKDNQLAAHTEMESIEAIEPIDGTEGVQEDAPIESVNIPLSKNAQKKLAKKLRYESERPERMKKHRERKIAKKEAYKAAKANGEIVHREKPLQVPSMLKIIVDCSFDAFMIEKEIKSMCSQLTRCHAENRSAKHPCTLYLTGMHDQIAERFNTVFKDQHRNWKGAKVFAEDYLDEATGVTVDDIKKEDLIYLTADSSVTIDAIDETKTYIIGGIVDKNRHKNLCYNKATRQGIKTARLPIGDYVHMASRKVLTVNHVFEILSRWLE